MWGAPGVNDLIFEVQNSSPHITHRWWDGPVSFKELVKDAQVFSNNLFPSLESIKYLGFLVKSISFAAWKILNYFKTSTIPFYFLKSKD